MSSTNFLSLKTRNLPTRSLYKFVIVVETRKDGSGPQKVVSLLNLQDLYYFPDIPEIDSSMIRQGWIKGEIVNINWPDDGTGKKKLGVRNVLPVVVHGLYIDKQSATKAEEMLLREISELSAEREKQQQLLEEESMSDGEENVSDGIDESHNSPFVDGGEDMQDQGLNPSGRRGRKRPIQSSGSNSSPISDASQKIIDLLETEKQAHKDEMDTLKGLVGQLIKANRELAKKVDSNSRTTSSISRQIAGKVVSSGPLLHDETNDLFDAQTEPVLYMGINRTEEINKLYRTAKSEGAFIRALGRRFYGDDLYFYMFNKYKTSLIDSTNERNSLDDRDPDGVALIKKILFRFWEKSVWVKHVDNVRKSDEMEIAEKAAQVGDVEKIRRELAKLKKAESEKWINEAVNAMNKWGNDAKGRLPSPWTESLFGKSVMDETAIKPVNYDASRETEWRQFLLAKKKHPGRSTESFLPELNH